MTPVELIKKRFGGARALSRSLGINHSAIVRWKHIPPKRHTQLLELAKALKVKLTGKELIHGGE